MAAISRSMKVAPSRSFAQPASSKDIAMLHRELDVERRRGPSHDSLLARMWKTMQVMFNLISPKDLQELPFMSEAEAGDPAS
ncbi:hypothetical protein KY290_021142 [Solanum tuberosum]|uniref:Uncharacterized protein n=1 Tax=Solanum tuberosum TaxID=4113 RepID=A0ABQ7V0P1_SOLTU|nr:hypothetical protein KY289_020317 [Solanum tuberosum]KAH0692976.1 hypothetical protein KY285_020073 [Solanum tuberosum]KAH0757649.1 hypothetical protein KY290_021142 [Solanum tuberosum]